MSKHQCRACVVYCIDFRFHDHLNKFIANKGLDKEADIVCEAGAAKNLASEEGIGRQFVLEQLEISRRLHNIREIYLINHEDCGAYGLEDEVDSEEELEEHRKDLRCARRLLEERFAGVEIFTYFMTLAGGAIRVE